MQSKRESSPWLFPSSSKAGHQKDLRRTLKTICEAAGVEGLRTHDLRRSFASGLANKGASAMAIRDLLGHQDVRTTQRVYAHMGLGTLRDACEMMSGDLGFSAA
jgi:site-specific recombinase XerD